MNDLHWNTEQCCCAGCLETLGTSAADVDFTLDPSNPAADPGDPYNDKPIWSAYQTAQHIARTSHTFADDADDPDDWTEVTYRFRDAEYLGNPDHVFETENQQHTREILEQYAEVADIRFTEVTSQTDQADINFQYRDGANGGGYWNGRDVVVSRVGWEPEMEYGTYNRRLMLHEIGHGLGLSHPGQYNGGGSTYDSNADHWNDSYQYTNMSYWSETETGAYFGHMSTLALHDILAIQIEYGTNWETRSGDDVYGFNATAGDAYDFSTMRTDGIGYEVANTDMAFAIWDGSGHDTLDFSGSNRDTELDLREGSFSSANGQIYNVSIAYGAVIENGVGSEHDDLIQGNAVGNTLWGGDGDDIIIGGAIALVPADTERAFTGISLNEDPNVFDQRLQVENFNGFSNGSIDIDMMISITRMSVRDTPLLSYEAPDGYYTFVVEAGASGDIRIIIDGRYIYTDIETISLIDGNAHRFGVTWDQDTGALKIHVDGVLAWEDVHQPGTVIASGGTLIFGQTQSGFGDGFEPRETFQGAIGDIRIFDAPRDDATVARDAFNAPTRPPAHHWVPQNDTPKTISDIGTGAQIDLIAADRDNVTVTMSSQYGTGEASRINDGNANTFGHTLNGEAEFISLRFETAITGERIEIINRYSNAARLNGAEVSIFDADGELIETFAPITGASWRARLQFDLPDDVPIGEIRITHSNQFLHIAEVKILGVGDGAAQPLEIFNDAQIVNIGDTGPTIPDADTLYGGAGQDSLYGGYGDDELIGESGNDALHGGTGNDHLDGGVGADIIFDNAGDDEILGGAGIDRISALSGANDIDGGAEQDLIIGGIGADDLRGSDGDDVLIGDVSTTFFGNDTLDGGAGDDLLQGGRGADIFVFRPDDGSDTIARLAVDYDDVVGTVIVAADFQTYLDKLDLSAFDYTSAEDALSKFEMINGHATFADQGTQIILFDTTRDDLSADNIIYL